MCYQISYFSLILIKQEQKTQRMIVKMKGQFSKNNYIE